MKAREAFEQIRNRKDTMSLKTKMILIVSAEIVLSLLFALGTTAIVSEIASVDSNVVLFFEILLFGLIIGAFITGFLSKLFFIPIKKLRESIQKVADGDFSVQLEIKNYSKEIQEIYSGFNLMVQELENIMERLVVWGTSEHIQREDIQMVTVAEVEDPLIWYDEDQLTLPEILAVVERHQVQRAIEIYGTTRRAAKKLGISQSTLVRRMKEFNIYPGPASNE